MHGGPPISGSIKGEFLEGTVWLEENRLQIISPCAGALFCELLALAFWSVYCPLFLSINHHHCLSVVCLSIVQLMTSSGYEPMLHVELCQLM